MKAINKIAKLDYIDALRGIAILMVVVHHTAQQGAVFIPKYIAVALSLGTRGVQLFFIASAFTLFRSYHNRLGTEKEAKRNFFIRRFFRIAPIYYLGILYYCLALAYNLPFWLGMQPEISFYNLIFNTIFLHGISPFWINSLVPGGWSIAVEMMFYMLFPFIFTKITTINRAVLFLNFSLLFKVVLQESLIYFHLLPDGILGETFLFYYLPAQLPLFAMGFVLYFLIEKSNSLQSISISNLLLFIVLMPMQIGITFNFLYLNHIIFGLFFVGLAFFMSTSNGTFISILPLRYVGQISYSMYIIHFVVISWLSHFNLVDFCEQYALNFMIRLGLVLGCSVLLSTATYHWIEIPFQNWAKKIIAKKN